MLFLGGVFVFHIWETITQLSITEWPEIDQKYGGRGGEMIICSFLRALASEGWSLLFSATAYGRCSAGRWQFWSFGSPVFSWLAIFTIDELLSASELTDHTWLHPLVLYLFPWKLMPIAKVPLSLWLLKPPSALGVARTVKGFSHRHSVLSAHNK